MNLNRLLERLRGHDAGLVDEAREAVKRTEQIRERVESQWPEVYRHDRFASLTIRENHLSPKIRAAVRGER